MQGYLAAAGHDFTYPAIGVTAAGRGVMTFSDTGDSTYPSATYAPIDASVGVGAWFDVPGGSGAAADDGFTSYKAQVGNPPRTRWGDYGAAAVDGTPRLDRQRVHRGQLRLHYLGRPVLRGRLRRQPARHLRWRQPRTGTPHGARQLVDPYLEVRAVVARAPSGQIR